MKNGSSGICLVEEDSLTQEYRPLEVVGLPVRQKETGDTFLSSTTKLAHSGPLTHVWGSDPPDGSKTLDRENALRTCEQPTVRCVSTPHPHSEFSSKKFVHARRPSRRVQYSSLRRRTEKSGLESVTLSKHLFFPPVELGINGTKVFRPQPRQINANAWMRRASQTRGQHPLAG